MTTTTAPARYAHEPAYFLVTLEYRGEEHTYSVLTISEAWASQHACLMFLDNYGKPADRVRRVVLSSY